MPKRLAQVYLNNMGERYQNAPKRVKSQTLTEFCASTALHAHRA